MKHKNNQGVTFLELWFQVFFSPEEALSNIPRNKLIKNVIIFGLLYGVFYNIGDFLEIYMNPGIPIIVKFMIGLIRCFMPIIIFFIMSGIIYFVGKWLGGKAKLKEILRVLPWSFIPLISIEICISIVSLLLKTGLKVYINEYLIISIGMIFILFRLVGSIWSIRTIVVFLSIIQKYSKLLAFLNLVFMFVVAVLPMIILF